MTIHMIKIHCGPQSSWTLTQCNLTVEEWMLNQSEWQSDPTIHEMSVTSALDTSLSWFAGEYRLTFDSEPKSDILQKLEDKLKNNPDWYRIGYHECDHDEPVQTGCSWDDERQWTDTNVTIPPQVPNFT